jgi:uncharacterized membrane protein
MNYKQLAKQHLQGIWGTTIVVLILFAIIQSLPSSYNIFAGRVDDPILLTQLISILLIPLTIGFNRYFLLNAQHKNADIDTLFDGFINGRYATNLLTMLLMMLYLIGWTILFIIPGIIKSFSYAMVPFILADDDYDHLQYNDVITQSREMMDGHKLELFILFLSFILWIILIPLTFGLAALYVVPYMQQTITEFYIDRKH